MRDSPEAKAVCGGDSGRGPPVCVQPRGSCVPPQRAPRLRSSGLPAFAQATPLRPPTQNPTLPASHSNQGQVQAPPPPGWPPGPTPALSSLFSVPLHLRRHRLFLSDPALVSSHPPLDGTFWRCLSLPGCPGQPVAAGTNSRPTGGSALLPVHLSRSGFRLQPRTSLRSRGGKARALAQGQRGA